MIYITGDIHGETLRIANMIERFGITPEDTIVILGDVGMNYYGNKHGDRRRKKQLNKHGIKVLCIHGNHEARPESLITYHEEQWNGGTIYVEEEFPNLLFAKDGEVYDLEGCKAIAIGGAYSVDKWYRLQCDLHWFPDEQPSDEIKRYVEQQIKAPWMIAPNAGSTLSKNRPTIKRGTVVIGTSISASIKCTFSSTASKLTKT